MNRCGLAGTVFSSTTGSPPTTCRPSPRPASRAARCSPASTRTTLSRPTLETCADAVSDLARHRLLAMVEPFISHRAEGRVRNELTADAMARANSIAAGLGSSRPTPAQGPDRRRDGAGDGRHHAAALILGGEVAEDQQAAFANGRRHSPCPRCRAWSSAGCCSTRRATTSRRRSTRRWVCCGRQAGDRDPGRDRGEATTRSRSPRNALAGTQQPQCPGAGRRRDAHLRTGESEWWFCRDRVVHGGL